MDRTQLAAQFPALLQSILAEGHASGLEAGATAERARIQGVEASTIPGHEALVAALKFDGKTTPGDAALAQVEAEKKLRANAAAANIEAAPKPVLQAAAPAVELSAEAQAQADTDAATAGAQGIAPAGYSVHGASAMLHSRATAYQAKNPGVSYVDAIKAIQKGA